MSTYPPGMTLRPLDGWPKDFTRNRRSAPFRSTFTSTLELLDTELRLLDPKDSRYPPSVLQIALRERDIRVSDGMPRADARPPSHPGVILTVEPRNLPSMSFPCDTFDLWGDNLRAIALGLEALRKINRYGITETGQQYRGWQAIEARPSADIIGAACQLLARIAWPNENAEHRESWAPKIATDPEIGRNTYRKAVFNAHPDRNGGDSALWDDVTQAAAVLGLNKSGVAL